jgi:hypothetical protein
MVAGLLFGWLICALIGAIIGQRRGVGIRGFMWGFFLGPIGCLLVALLPGKSKRCPQCDETVRPGALVCKHCGADVSLASTSHASETAVQLVYWALFAFVLVPIAVLMLRYAYIARQARIAEEGAAVEKQKQQAAATKGEFEALNTPTPPPTAPPAAFLTDVGYSQQAAVAKYPQLGVTGSPLNRKFLARLAEWKKAADLRLTRSNWPEQLADECAKSP